jgi:3-deoxy-D-manno-octulosonate 8-phosphate phosphatase KdsC-like HAD superfamily phosphatase
MLAELFATDLARDPESCLYVGDSLNDAPMFGFFPHSVGVATVRDCADRMPSLPRWITRGAGGAGFVEVADALLR